MNLPKITSPPPDAAALGKYGQVPLDKNSGLPQISIPLYEIKTPRFVIPISLSYHASGIKVDEMASWVGTGWTLNAGGVITRSIINKADELGFLSNPLKTAAEIITDNDIPYLTDAIRTPLAIDTQPDNFFYNFVNQSGAFVFGKDHKPLLTPYKPIVITFTITPYPGTFSVLDDSGNIYNFKDTERTISSISETMSGTTSWYLSEMISADRSDTVKFIYDRTATSYNMYAYSFTQNYSPPVNSGFACSWQGSEQLLPINKSVVSTTPLNPAYLKRIEFKGGVIDFVAKGGRLDGPPRSLDSIIVSGYDYAKNKYGRVKALKLHTGYWDNYLTPPTGYNNINVTRYRLKLDSLTENGVANIAVKVHRFDYNSLLLPPVGFFSQDYWGYYNGRNTNKTLLEAKDRLGKTTNGAYYDVYTVGGSEGADRKPDTSYLKAGMLEKITYPTKGYTVFKYEPHSYLDYNNTQIRDENAQAAAAGYYDELHTTNFTSGVADNGGYNMGFVSVLLKHTSDFPGQLLETPYVRIVKISDNSVIYEKYATHTGDQDFKIGVALQPNTQYKLIALAKGGNSSMSASLLPTANIAIKYAVGSTQGPSISYGGGLRVASIQNYDSNNKLTNKETYKYGLNGAGTYMNGGLAFLNSHIRTFNYMADADNEGFRDICTINATVYASNSLYPLSSLSGGPVAYDNVTVYQGDDMSNTGMSVYSYQNFPDSILTVPGNYQNGVKTIPVTWKNGQLSYEAHSRNMGNNTYSKVQEKFYQYRNYPRTAGYGLYIGTRDDQLNFPLIGTVYDLKLYTFTFFDYPISSGTRVPTRTVTINYDPNSSAVLQRDTVKYYYENLKHLYPTRIVSSTSTKDSIVSLVRYPEDMFNAGDDPSGVYATMKSRNIINAQVQFTKQRNNTLLTRSVTNYIDTLGMQKSKTVEIKNGTGPSEVRLRYNSYDVSGNALTISKENAPAISYKWGYGKQYPVAEVKNAAFKDMFYEGFEEGPGNSALNDAKTGHYSKADGYSKSLNGLTNRKYKLSYWRKSGTAWIYSVIENISVTGGSYNIAISNTLQVDDIRFYPSDAQMTTYTYDPLIGMTSSTDEKGMTTYYEYDGFNRLRNIKDQNGNILKNYCYNYAGQQTGCPISGGVGNQIQSQAYTKACGTNSTGSSVTYTVQPNSFFAATQGEANALALADIAANGQANANSTGTCSVVTTPYARMVQLSTSMTNNETTDVYAFRLYSDSDLTIPFTATTSITVKYKITTVTTSSNPTTTVENNYTATIPSGSGQATVSVVTNTCAGSSNASVQAKSAQTAEAKNEVSPNAVPINSCISRYVELMAGTGYLIYVYNAE